MADKKQTRKIAVKAHPEGHGYQVHIDRGNGVKDIVGAMPGVSPDWTLGEAQRYAAGLTDAYTDAGIPTIQATHSIFINGRRLWLDPDAHDDREVKGFHDSEQCDGCGSDIGETGVYTGGYFGELIKCGKCDTKYYVEQEKR